MAYGAAQARRQLADALRRVEARGSDPEAVEEAEGDFGPGGLFVPEA
jgi:hypothetical protein